MAVDMDALLAEVDLADLVGRYVDLKKSGREYVGLCPAHADHHPSFYVVPHKGFVRCFSCGFQEDAVGFLQHVESIDFREACRRLGAHELPERTRAILPPLPPDTSSDWTPIIPAPAIPMDPAKLWNAKRNDWLKMRSKPERVDAYTDAAGAIHGYVIRWKFEDGGKYTPQVTFARHADGRELWCVGVTMPAPRPLLGLRELAERPAAQVLVVEGERTRAEIAGQLTSFCVVTWAGGSNAVTKTDWAPLRGRRVTIHADKDGAGFRAGHLIARLIHGAVAQV